MSTSEKCRMLLEASKKATPGPWMVVEEDVLDKGSLYTNDRGTFLGIPDNMIDAQFIAASDPTTVTEICEAYLNMEERLVFNSGCYEDSLDRIQELETQIKQWKQFREADDKALKELEARLGGMMALEMKCGALMAANAKIRADVFDEIRTLLNRIRLTHTPEGHYLMVNIRDLDREVQALAKAGVK